MPFNSPGFFLLFVATLGIYYLRRTERWQHTVLFLSSFAFYWFAGPRDLMILLGSVLLNHWLARANPTRLRTGLLVSLNLGILAFFKYRHFLVGLFIYDAPTNASIPLGISFYLFQLIAYQVDLYRGAATYEPSFARLLLYVLFFPHHQAGPIMRPRAFLPQFQGIKSVDWPNIGNGFRWVFYGLFQKTCADRIAEVVDPLFLQAPHDAASAWLQTFGFGVQIYGDFAGYSNMAIGFGLLLGYRLDRNFNQPYLASDPAEFWKRWHITLSAWLRDYLYIPLGGNKTAPSRTYVNLMLTMALGGLWHGASWNFVIWGALHGALLCFFRAVPLARWSPAASTLVCQIAVFVLWVPFRATDAAGTFAIWRAMLSIGVPFGNASRWLTLAVSVAIFFGIHLLEGLTLQSPARGAAAYARWQRVPSVIRGGVAAIVFLSAIALAREGTTFIYFRF